MNTNNATHKIHQTPTEHSNLINGSVKPNQSNVSQSFIIATSFYEELKYTLKPCFLITMQLSIGWGSIMLTFVMVGQLPDSPLYLSGVGLASTFVNVTAVAVTWGFTTALFTLLPQSVGAGHTRLASIYIQRAFYIVTIISAMLSILQFFAGEILIAIGQPRELRSIMNAYCQILIPYIFLCGYAAILERTMQSLNLNISLLVCYVLQFAITIPTIWFFMYYWEFGYKGAAIARSFTTLVMVICMFCVLLYYGFGYMFIPHNLSTIWTKKGMYQYITLAAPGLFQNAFEWIIQEVAVILAGYVTQPQIAMSTCVILSNVFNVVILSVSIGVCNGTNLRVAKYIGYGSVHDAKRAAKIGLLIGGVIIVFNAVLFVLGRDIIPIIFTNDQETILLTSQMILFLIILSFGCVILQTVGGIYRGLGFQTIAAIIVFVSYWIIAFPIGFVLLFGYNWRDNLYYGVTTIIGNLTLGNVLSAVGCGMYLLCFIDWNKAVKQSTMRVETTMREYDTINQCK